MSLLQVAHVCTFLEAFAPPQLAEDWDNVGLLVGDRLAPVSKIMTCLTVTPDSAAEAIDRDADLIVTHHPMPFRPVKRLTTDSTIGKILLDLIRNGVAVYSPHTAFDSAISGINQQLAEGLGLLDIRAINAFVADENSPDLSDLECGPIGSGRIGRLASPSELRDVIGKAKELLSVSGLHVVGDPVAIVSVIAVACGSAGQFLGDANRLGCDVLLTGETNFHTCLEAEATGVHLILPGHYASERFAVERLAETMSNEFPNAAIWPSEREHDPLRWI
jgi:dinuclear metal center YbgI/SA1388 family protein